MNPEHPGFNPNLYQPPGESSDDSKEKSKTKAKKSAETAQKQSDPEQRESKASARQQTAERAKEILDKLLNRETAEEKAEAQPPEKSETTATQAAAETGEDAEESVDAVAELSEAEKQEVIEAYVPARIAELKAGRSEAEEPADAAAREADIEYLEGLLTEPSEGDSAEDAEAAAEVSPPGPETDFALWENEIAGEFDEDQPVQVAGAVGRGPLPPAAQPRPGAGSPQAGPGSNRPPAGPHGPGGAAMPPANPGLPNFNTVPAPSAKLPEYVPDYRQNPNATYLLVGGIVGYFIGRRRGRIKTEKRMGAVQRKLETQVAEVQSELAAKETQIQKAAREAYWQHKVTPKYDRAPSAVRPVPVAEKQPPRAEKPVANLRLTAERRESAAPQKTRELTKAQLLETGASIKVGNTNLRRIYEARLISESGLKRLVHESLEGHDIRRGLAREFLAKELSYERDPRFRDLVPAEVDRRAATSRPQAALDMTTLDQFAKDSPDLPEPPPAKAGSKDPNDRSRQMISGGLLTALTLLAFGLAAFAVLLTLLR